MSLSRLLRGTLPVLLLWPLLCSIVTLSLAPARQRAAAMRPMACCAMPERGSDCGRCETGPDAGACGLGASAGATCTLSATPCRRPTPTTLTPFAWEPFTATGHAIATPHSHGQRAPMPSRADGAARAIPVMERPPAA
jgi:hypothetical protein